MNKEMIIKSLITGLHDELMVYQRLLNLLMEQHRLMARHDTVTLAENNERETQLLGLLYQRSKQRSLWLKSLGLNPDEKGMQQFIESLPTALQPKVEALWSKIYQQLRLCQAQNEQNSRLLTSQRDTIQRLLFGDSRINSDYSSLACR